MFLKIFRIVRKLSGNFGNCSKPCFTSFYDFNNFLKIFGSFRKSSDIYVKVRVKLKTNFEEFL